MGDRSNFAAQIHEGLFDPSPRESIFRVKDAVARELAALDSTARVRSTDFFNHSFAPDFILTWPDESTRRVYLRFTYDLDSLADDVALIDSPSPLIFGLTSEEAVKARPVVDKAIADTSAMFTEPAALERLIDRKQSDSTANMLSNALAQGGRGSFVADEAVELAAAVSRGFEGAAQVQREPTAEAIEAINDRLDGPQAWRMNRVLQAVWEGSEGSLSHFPGIADTSGHLNAESLQYLVKYMRTADRRFWKRVGRRLRLADLESLDFTTDSENIQHLIQANLDVIPARAAIVRSDGFELERATNSPLFSWSRQGRHLAFNAPSTFVIVGAAKKDLEGVELESAQPVSIDQFAERSIGFDLVEVNLRSGHTQFISKNDEGKITPELLRNVSEAVGGSVEVGQAIVATRSGRVTIDLPTQEGAGVTRSNLLMADLLCATLPLVSPMTQEHRDALVDHLGYEIDIGQTPMDFSGLNDWDAAPSSDANSEHASTTHLLEFTAHPLDATDSTNVVRPAEGDASEE
ncbi:hypothetical protein [Microbacterium gorillae]|uniref:hypothetical protein n=1 Tax=Microbacterium gorillae TaxID=1231063 RepID=UPI003D9655C2